MTFEVYNSYGALIQKDVNVLQGEVVPPTLIFNETAGNEAVDDKPLVSAYTGWNTTGEGASKVSYEGTNTSIRSSGKSSAGAYDGASGPNVIFFGSAPATFTVKNILFPQQMLQHRQESLLNMQNSSQLLSWSQV